MACTGSQGAQASPGGPQAPTLKGTQASAAQQPSRQLAGVHWQRPPTQSRPGPQLAPVVPHTQAPEVQRSLFEVRQLWQTAPPMPQAEATGA